tara:strand:- start:3335 stop:3916 length:582 start_codon:yes stop_codon:yes gene_type:complete
MATYTLVPDADHLPDAGDWTINNSAPDIHSAIDATGIPTISTAATNKDFRVGFTTQALGTGETIDSIQACITGHTGNTRSETAVVRIDIENASNTDYFTDNHTVTENGGVEATYCSAVETTSDGGSTAWTQGDIDAIRMDGEVTSFSGGSPTVILYFAYITVETTVPTTYLSEDKIICKNGTLVFSNGTADLK